MKKSLTALYCLGSCALALVCYVYSQGGRFWCSDQSCGFYLTAGGYRSWEIAYSKGLRISESGRVQNIWCAPRFWLRYTMPFVQGTNIVLYYTRVVTNGVAAGNFFTNSPSN